MSDRTPSQEQWTAKRAEANRKRRFTYRGAAWQRWLLFAHHFNTPLYLATRSVLLLFRQRLTKRTSCILSIKRIAEQCGLRDRSVSRALRELETHGIIQTTHRFQRPSIFKLVYGDRLTERMIKQTFTYGSGTHKPPPRRRSRRIGEGLAYNSAYAQQKAARRARRGLPPDCTTVTADGRTEKQAAVETMQNIKHLISVVRDDGRTADDLYDQLDQARAKLLEIRSYESAVAARIVQAGMTQAEWIRSPQRAGMIPSD